MSGHTGDIIPQRGIPAHNVLFQKPFDKRDLAVKVSEAFEKEGWMMNGASDSAQASMQSIPGGKKRISPSSFILHPSSLLLASVIILLRAVFPGGSGAAEHPHAPIQCAAEIAYPSFSMVNENGRADGFSVELLKAALAVMGKDVTFRAWPWAQVREWLETGVIQVLPLAGRPPERERLFDFTFPYMSMHGAAIVVRKDAIGIQDMMDLRGKTVTAMKGDNAEEFLRREDRGIDIHTTDTFEQALREPSHGLYDPVVIRYAAVLVTPLLVLLLFVLLWSWMLHRQVSRKTLELRKSTALQQAIIACSPVALYSLDPSGNITSWNSSAERIFGWRADEIVGKPLPIVPEEKHSEFQDLRNQVLNGRVITGMELIRIRKDGEYFPIDLSAAPIRKGNGDIVGIMAAAEDISDRKRLEAELRKKELVYRSLFDNSMDAFLITVPEGDILDANPAACKLFGRTVEKMKRANWNELVDSPSPNIWKTFNELARTGKTNTQITIVRSDGATFPAEVSSSVYRDVDGPETTSMIVRDITDRKEAEEDLKASKTYLQTVLDSVSNAVFIHDANSLRIIDVNERMCEMYGYTREEAIALSIDDLNQGEPPFSRTEAMEWLRRSRDIGPQSYEWRAKHRGGHLFWVEVNSRFVAIGGRYRFVVVVRDIDRRKAQEVELEEQMDELKRWQNVMLDREDRILGLKREVNELCSRAGESPRYQIVEGNDE